MSTFIFKKGSLHAPGSKRILFVVFKAPFLLLIIFINQLFLLLDNLLFFAYRRIKIEKSVFIIGVPRSATTYMYELLYRDEAFFFDERLPLLREDEIDKLFGRSRRRPNRHEEERSDEFVAAV